MAEYREIQVADVDRRFQLRKSLPRERGVEVVQSIKKHGVLKPVRVDAKGQLLVGDVELWGARSAGHSSLPALVDSKEYSEVEAICLQLAADVQDVPLKISERADGIERLIELTQWTATEVASTLGMSSASITRLRSIAKLEPAFRELIDASLGESKGYELARLSAPEREALLPRLRQGLLTREELAAVRKPKGDKQASETVAPKKVKAFLDDGHTVTVQGTELDMDRYIDAIRVVLRKAKRAQSRGVHLTEFARSMAKSRARASRLQEK